MKTIPQILIICCVLTVWVSPARADLDQLCLKQCISNSNDSRSCMTNCSYNLPPADGSNATTKNTPLTPTKPAASHNVFDAPMLISSDQIIVNNKTSSASPTKDYVCFNQCLHNGNAYALCDRQCTKVTCAMAGDSPATTGLAGTANSVSATTCAKIGAPTNVTGVLNGNAIAAPHY